MSFSRTSISDCSSLAFSSERAPSSGASRFRDLSCSTSVAPASPIRARSTGNTCLSVFNCTSWAKARQAMKTGPASRRSTNRALVKSMSRPFYLDTINKTVWSSAAFNGRLRGRAWLERVLREPRKQEHEIFVPDAVVPRAGRPIVTLLTLALLAAVFVLEQLAKGSGEHGIMGVDVGTLFAMGGANSSAILNDGQWYRLLTAALLHADALHLLFNGVALGLAGYLLEALIGPAWLVVLFFLGALGGSLMGLAVNSAEVVSVGASGAVMGLLAAALVASLRLPRGQERTSVQLPLFQFLLPSLLPLATHRQEGHVDFAAHFGGAIIGALFGFVLLKIWPREQERPRFPAVAKGGALLAAASFVLSGVLAESGYAGAADAVWTSADAELLIDEAKIPISEEQAAREVDLWGKDYPRDPRVHYYRALRLIDEQNVAQAMTELRAALGEQKILDRAFSNRRLELVLRTALCELLLDEKNLSEAETRGRPRLHRTRATTATARARVVRLTTAAAGRLLERARARTDLA